MVLPEEKFIARLESAWLHDLDFVELYVSLYDDLPSYYQMAEPGQFNVMPKNLAPEYHADIMQLRRELGRGQRRV